MASTNLIAHVVAGLALIFLVWLFWQEKKNSTLLRSLYRPEREWIVALSGSFLVHSLVAAGIEHDYEALSREPRKIPLKALGDWLQMLPKGVKVHVKATEIEIHLSQGPVNSDLQDKIEGLKLISGSLEAAFELKFSYLLENKHV